MKKIPCIWAALAFISPENKVKKGYELICTVENPANAALIAESKNMYYALNDFEGDANSTWFDKDKMPEFIKEFITNTKAILNRINNK